MLIVLDKHEILSLVLCRAMGHYSAIFMSTCLDVCVATGRTLAQTSLDPASFCNSFKCHHSIHTEIFVTGSASHTRSGCAFQYGTYCQ